MDNETFAKGMMPNVTASETVASDDAGARGGAGGVGVAPSPDRPAAAKSFPSPPAETSPAPATAAKRSSWLPEGVVRNLAILWGACLGAAYEVTRIPTTVQNFNKAVYATTGYLGEYLPRGYDRALGAVDYYAMVADVVSALAFFVLNVVVAIAMVMVTVRVITLFTGYGESALNFVCIPFTWTSSVKAVRHLSASLEWNLPTAHAYALALASTVVVVEIFETTAPVLTRGLCLGVAFSFFATDLLQFAGGFVWIIGLLLATWTVRFFLRLALRLLARVFPPAAQIREALPKVSVIPGLKRAAEAMGSGARAGVELAGKAAGAASKGVRAATKTAKIAGRGGSKAGSTGAAAAVAGAKFGAAVGSVAARGTVYGVIAGIKGGVRAGVAAGEIAVRGTVLAGNVVAGAPTYAWRSASKVRSFVRLAAVQAEAALDPVAPKTRSAVKSKGGFGPQKLKL